MSATRCAMAIVGAGPAGLFAAAEARRQGVRSLVLIDEAGQAGGAIRAAHEVRNAPFLPDRIAGELVVGHLEQLRRRLEVPVTRDTVRELREEADGVHLSGEAGEWVAGAVVVATGTRPRHPGIAGLPAGFESPVAAQACDALGRGAVQRAAVIGAGDVAFDQARYLRARGVDTILLCRSDAARAPDWLVQQARCEGVNVWFGAVAASAVCEAQRTVLRIVQRGGARELVVDRVVAAVGRAPRLPHGAAGQGGRSWRVAGDASGGRARHLVAAMGAGCTAAFELLVAESGA